MSKKSIVIGSLGVLLGLATGIFIDSQRLSDQRSEVDLPSFQEEMSFFWCCDGDCQPCKTPEVEGAGKVADCPVPPVPCSSFTFSATPGLTSPGSD